MRLLKHQYDYKFDDPIEDQEELPEELDEILNQRKRNAQGKLRGMDRRNDPSRRNSSNRK
ncbi:hypothetical protein Ab1vBOLIVR2_gp22 [Agrobacterium phage OLIVR2]|uniref:Uncharacterized protein n=1 Tax=Agrobacterium phage OLIVR1 TaxID=2723769 RepID=A0A858MR12_9CAUD|nr:hypothetical protein [Xanthomonas campestris]YP_010107056.1 hypothetical protein KNU98_gp087 [Agrobacterium phage OLIVR1]QIW87325.1 hypothetical protein Ab1vBOLIVR2_gp22 [Agrobacterium phage OLIVR2]QIW87432.1 hypothetical protein Ab1vBOLIVR3_gp22 [Agrobacterium phage OLIVR3]MCF8861617.1 hypothetical protein [Xanthomonas campestris pv. campestris]QIW87217.1 hypothetical protein Ab1vBOLIVR1_gp22 [Agrobacterium phage OLIVR1]